MNNIIRALKIVYLFFKYDIDKTNTIDSEKI